MNDRGVWTDEIMEAMMLFVAVPIAVIALIALICTWAAYRSICALKGHDYRSLGQIGISNAIRSLCTRCGKCESFRLKKV